MSDLTWRLLNRFFGDTLNGLEKRGYDIGYRKGEYDAGVKIGDELRGVRGKDVACGECGRDSSNAKGAITGLYGESAESRFCCVLHYSSLELLWLSKLGKCGSS